MVKPIDLFQKLSPQKILVIGDFLLDTYTICKALRLSPEAPVPVVNVQEEHSKAGGAGNVVLNLLSLKAQVIAVGRTGNDVQGIKLKELLNLEGADISGLFIEQGYHTPIKNRIVAGGQQIVRIDHERITPIPELLEQQIIETLPKLLKEVKAIAISDYGKGFLSKTLLSSLIELAKQQNIPVITDPKGTDFSKYSGSTVLKPNESEAYAAANLLKDSSLEFVAQRIFTCTEVENLMITRSEEGISTFSPCGKREDFGIKVKEVKDVTGAGDTVLATVSYALANKLSISMAVKLSNVAAGIAVEQFGCARVTLEELNEKFTSSTPLFLT